MRHSVTIAVRRGGGAPGLAPWVPAAFLEPLPRGHVQLALQLGGGLLAVDEVAESAADAAIAAVESAAGLPEVGDRGQFAVDGAAGVPAIAESVASLLGVLLVLEPDVDVADEIWSG